MKIFRLFVAFTLICFAFSPIARAVVPAPDGGYPGQNTAEGQSALLHLAGGTYNTALGWSSLGFNVTGTFNTAIGAGALLSNTADQNTATGAGALLNNTIGDSNTATGAFALFTSTTGAANTATGYQALLNDNIGDQNVATGYDALLSNTIGTGNTAVGFDALRHNTTGSDNIALGSLAGDNLTTGNGNIDIGSLGVAGESYTTRIGDPNIKVTKTFIAGISGVNEGGTPVAVYINGNGRLGTQPPSSSRRFKKDIKPMDNASEAILALKPVTFHYKSDKTNTPQFGLIAEEVGDVDPDLVVRDDNGEIYTVRYDQVNAMLLNEFLKEHREVAELKATVAEQRKGMEATAAQLKAQAAQIQKVSAQVELNKAAPQTVKNND